MRLYKFLKDLHQPMKILNFPDTRQFSNFDCGTACVQAVLWYYGIESREDKLIKSLNVDKTNGTFISKILKHLRKQKLFCSFGRLTIKQLFNNINNGIPTILLIQAWSDNKKVDYSKTYKDGHYVIVIGYDENGFYFDDPSLLGNRGFLTFDELKERWHGLSDNGSKCKNFGVGIYGKDPEYDQTKTLKIG